MKIYYAKNILLGLILLTISIDISCAREYIREYTYDASEADSKLSSRAIALDQIKTILLQEIGTHIRHQVSIQNNNNGKVYAQEEIDAITAGITRVSILDEKWNGESYYLKAKIKADAEKVINAIKEFKKSNEIKLKLLKDSQKLHMEIKNNLNLLRKKIVNNNTDSKLYEKYITNISKLDANRAYAKAMELDLNNNYRSAASLYLKAAEQGHTVSKARLGFMYMVGKGIKQNDKLAALWIKEAANDGYPLALNWLGDLYAEGIGVPYNSNTSVYYFTQAAKKGVYEAMINLQVYYGLPDTHTGNARNRKLANYWKNMAEKENVKAGNKHNN